MNVFTYYEPLPGFEDDAKLVELWKRSWEQQGWEATVLGRSDAERSPHFAALSRAADRLPTVNPKEYERACYIRHGAFHMVAHPLHFSVFVDYDIVNYGFTVADQLNLGYPLMEMVYHIDHGAVGNYIATKPGIRRIIEVITHWPNTLLTTWNGKPLIEDMHMIQAMAFERKNVVGMYGHGAWQYAKLVHFPNALTPKPRTATILRERPV